MKKLISKKIILLPLLALVMMTSGFSCKLLNTADQQLVKPITLNWWGTFDDGGNFSEIINDYRVAHPNITINYRKLRPEEFDQELLNALAEDRGPDIITLENTDLGRWVGKLEPLPATTKMAYQVTKTSLGVKQETTTEIRETTSLTTAKIKDLFLDAVYNDVVRDGKIYGLPVSVDTLVMFYNRDLFNNAGLPLAPKSWAEVQDYVKKLTYQDKSGNLIQSGIALGTPDNVKYFADILSLLMMQNRAEMTTGRQVTFPLIPSSLEEENYNPGLEAIRFYTDFATPAKEVYTWNQTFPDSLDAFAQGKVGMLLGYNSTIPYIEAKRQGKLNYAVAKMPQIEGLPEVNFAKYYLQTVSKKSKQTNEAWDFIQFISKAEEAKKYLTKTVRPTALRSLVEIQVNDDRLNIFATQLLTAKSWYLGSNQQVVETAFKEMIAAVLAGLDLPKAAATAASKIQQTL